MGAAAADRVNFRRRIDDAVLVLFALVTESVGWATTALLDEDVELANQVIADDAGVDERCAELTALVQERLPTTALDPDELENLVAVLQIVPELERSADLAEHIAQRATRGLGGAMTPRGRGLIQSMGDIAVQMWRAAATAYRKRSRDASFELSDADDELDELASRLVVEGANGNIDPTLAADLALVARFYERLGDHAVNLARRIDAMAAPRRMTTKERLSPRRLLNAPDEKSGRVRKVLRVLTRFRLVPTDEGFFELFEAAAANARDCADEVRKLTTSLSDLDEHYEEIRGFEHRGDEITHNLLERLDASFITPYDREDIHALAEELDDVVDDMFAAASLIHLVRADTALPEISELGDVLVAMAEEMVALIGCLRTGDGARHRLERIEHLERQGDFVFRRGMGRLFGGDYEPLEVIKLKDIVEAMERSLNAIEDVSDVVESILVKNS